MTELTQAFMTLGIILAGLLAIGGALTLVRGSYNRARIQALREDNDDLRARVKDCEDKIHDSEIREDALEAEVDHLKSRNTLLTSMITQRADVETVLTELRDHHQKAMDGQERLIKAVTSLKDVL